MIARATIRGAVLGLALLARPASAQQLGPSTGGLVAREHAARSVGQHKRVLMVAAHPDDEDTELLTRLARGEGAEVAYLSLTRGEGGQNLIGNELGPGLGILRSEELLAASQLDGARQYFTRAYDFGFSKSLADTWRFWPRDSVVKDVVRVIRAFRPQVVVAIFSGTPRDGHGQHQAAGWAAREAVAAAADSARFPELAREAGVRPWRAQHLYQSARFDTAGTTLVLEGGVLDPAVGQSFLQIAMRGRSLHRSQDMGSPQRVGPSSIRLRLVASSDPMPLGGGLFSGVDTTFAAFLPGPPREAIALQETLRRAAGARDPAGLARGRDELMRLGAAQPGPALEDQVARIDDLLFRLSDLLCDATTTVEDLIPGDRVRVTLQCWNASPRAQAVRMGLVPRPGLELPPPVLQELPPGAVGTVELEVHLPPTLSPGTPYYLRTPRVGALHQWDSTDAATRPFEPPVLEARFERLAGGHAMREVVHRTVDQAVGEVRRPLFVTPAVSATLSPAMALVPAAETGPREVRIRLRHWRAQPTRTEVGLAVPSGWSVTPPQSVAFQRRGEEHEARFTVTPARGAAGRFRIAVMLGDRIPNAEAVTIQRVAYEHVHPRQMTQPAEAWLEVAPLARPKAGPVAYVRGAADRVPETLESLGLPVTVLSGEDLRTTDLSRFVTVVIGPRAYEVDAGLPLANDRLLAFAEDGGTVLVQYQQLPYFQGAFAPHPLALTEPGTAPGARVGAARVAEEDAAVRLVEPDHPVFTTPNRISATDWDGWVQERGLYFPRQWGPEWVPLLEMADAGEAMLRGGLLVAAVGRGRYVYTGLSFFRQLPAGVPGATRLFLNLLDLGRR